MEIRCKLSVVDDTLYRLIGSVKESLRTYEVVPTPTSLERGCSMVCEYDYAVQIPALGLILRYAVEFEYDEEEQEHFPMQEILHYYHAGDASPIGGVYSYIRSHILWYIEQERLRIEQPDELECVIEFPYTVEELK